MGTMMLVWGCMLIVPTVSEIVGLALTSDEEIHIVIKVCTAILYLFGVYAGCIMTKDSGCICCTRNLDCAVSKPFSANNLLYSFSLWAIVNLVLTWMLAQHLELVIFIIPHLVPLAYSLGCAIGYCFSKCSKKEERAPILV